MTPEQETFLYRAVIDGATYDTLKDELGVDRKDLSKWWDDLKDEREALALIKRKWNSKKKKLTEEDTSLTFERFRTWYESTDKVCIYCEITPDKINQLWEKDPKLTKRNRGKSLEIERLKPNETYSNTENLVFSCYWCNNAKTDTFTAEEFKEVGEVFKKIWEKRLSTKD